MDINPAATAAQRAIEPKDHRITTIPLFGSRQLVRNPDGRHWSFVTGSTSAKKLTMRESMFINAALAVKRGR